MFSKLAYSTLALTVSLGTVMSCQAEVTGTISRQPLIIHSKLTPAI
jgi:hypothetical protein